jgi:hypothetical protein
MKYRFKFLLASGKTEYLSFTANQFADARKAASAYSQLAYKPFEVMDFFFAPRI